MLLALYLNHSPLFNATVQISEPDKDGSQQMETEEKAVVELINILQGLLCYFIVTVRKRRVERVTRLMMKAL
jgi:hypothetical protein